MRLDPIATARRLYDTPLKRGIIIVLLFAAGTLLPFLLVPFEDFRYGDEPYQAYCCEHYEKGYLGMLSFYIGNLWMRLFGHTFIALRCLMTLCYIVSVAIGCVFVKKQGFSTLQTAIVYLIGTLGIILSYLPLYGWDAGAYPFTALGLLATLLYAQSPCRSHAILMGFSASLMTLSRIPLLAAIPIMLATIVVKKRFLQSAGRATIMNVILLFIITYIVTFLIVTTIMTGNPYNYIKAISPENTVAAHSIYDYDWIIDRCVKQTYNFYHLLLPGCMAILLSVYCAMRDKLSLPFAIFAVLTIYYAAKGAHYSTESWRSLFWSNNGIMLPEAFIAIFFAPLLASLSNWKIQYSKTALGILVLFCLLQAVGSNSATERIGWGLSMVFAFGVSCDAFRKAKKFTFYFLIFTTTISGLFFAIKVRGLYRSWPTTTAMHYATAFNGTRPFANEYNIVESIDSIKFIKDNAEKLGLKTIAVGTASNSYNFPLEERGDNAGIRFDVYPDDVIADVKRLNPMDNEADIIIGLSVTADSCLYEYLANRGYIIYQETHYPRLIVYAKSSTMRTLPPDPYTSWGYKKGSFL